MLDTFDVLLEEIDGAELFEYLIKGFAIHSHCHFTLGFDSPGAKKRPPSEERKSFLRQDGDRSNFDITRYILSYISF